MCPRRNGEKGTAIAFAWSVLPRREQDAVCRHRSRGRHRSRRNVWESRPSERLPQAPLVVIAVVVGALLLQIPRQNLEDK